MSLIGALNDDVLLSIISISPAKTATSIMETCRFLYHEGAKIVLKHPVYLKGSEEEVLAMLRFIQAEDHSRCSYVRTLHIAVIVVPETVATILANLVPRMSNLECLRLIPNTKPLLEPYPYLLTAFASLRSVKMLTMVIDGDQSCELLRTLQSELVYANIFFRLGSHQDQSSAMSMHLLLLLQRSASTLQKFRCGFWRRNGHMDIKPLIASPEFIYPEVRKLILSHDVAPSGSPVPYIRAFPNLAHLEVESNCPLVGEFALRARGLSRRHREVNLMQQSLPLAIDDRRPLSWKHIQSYVGPLSDLWTLALAFPIPRLYLTTDDKLLPHSPLDALTDVLASARPVHLKITFPNRPLSNTLNFKDFLSALRSDGASGLRSLELVIHLMADDRDLDVGHALGRIEAALSGLQLYDLRFTVCDVGLFESETAASAPSESPSPRRANAEEPGEDRAAARAHEPGADAARTAPCSDLEAQSAQPPLSESPCSEAGDRASLLSPGERTLDDFDVRAFVRRLLFSIPTIRNAIISVGRPRRCGGCLRTGWFKGERTDEHNDESPHVHTTRDSIVYRELGPPS